MKPEELLSQIKIASPCPAQWELMEGDDRRRFCSQCTKHVYNISSMTAKAAADLIREKEGNLCIQLHRRADGTVLTADCPVGIALFWSKIKTVGSMLAALVMVGCNNIFPPTSPEKPKGGNSEAGNVSTNFVRELGDVITPRPPPAIKGEMHIPPETIKGQLIAPANTVTNSNSGERGEMMIMGKFATSGSETNSVPVRERVVMGIMAPPANSTVQTNTPPLMGEPVLINEGNNSTSNLH